MQFTINFLMNKLAWIGQWLLVLAAFYLPVTYADDMGEQLSQQCVACHGNKGVSQNDEWPILAGQKQGYLIKELTAFRDGTRHDILMSPMAAKLTDSDITSLALYFSQQENNAKQIGNENLKGKHVRAFCVSCHGMTGNTVNTLWPNLAGQKNTYLRKQLLAFKSGSRKSPIMEVIANELSDQQISDVAEYYSQQVMKSK